MIIKVAIKCQTSIEEVFCYMVDVKNNRESFYLSTVFNIM